MKSAKEIFNKIPHLGRDGHYFHMSESSVIKAMEDYAKQFTGEWFDVNERKEINGGWYLVIDTNKSVNFSEYGLAFYHIYTGLWEEQGGDIIHPTYYMKLPAKPYSKIFNKL